MIVYEVHCLAGALCLRGYVVRLPWWLYSSANYNLSQNQSSSHSERYPFAILPVSSFSMAAVYVPRLAAALHLAR
jgi:hypothetical protein